MTTPEMTTPVLTQTHAGICTITLNRPAALNALEHTLLVALKEALDNAAADNTVRVVVITGAGRGFCAGADLIAAMPKAGGDVEQAASNIGQGLRTHYHPIIMCIRNMPKPVITAINGPAAGAGMSLAISGDIVLAAQSATFLQAFAKIGLIPDAGSTYFLPRAIGEIRARAMAMLAEPMSANDALQAGLVWKVFPDEELTHQAQKLAAKMAAMPTKAFALMKQALNASLSNDLAAQLELEATLQSEAGKTHDFYEGVSAFIQKRSPAFKGH
jgi:2-(1,2-epoxy-1,2-dihydrophenyl)acetyl-CoA isomerase